jgi:hypothetical protein
MRSILFRWRYLTLLTVAPLLLFWRWVVLGEVLYWGTTMLQFWPWRQLVKESLLAGSWPLWNPLVGNGAPLLANHQSAVFYPLNWLYLLAPVEHGLTFSVVLHLVIAGGSMYFYGLHLGLRSFPATIAALSYMFSGYIAGRTQFVVMVNAAAWLPLLLLLGDRLATRRTATAAVWLGVVLALQFLAGHAQLWFYSLILLGAYTLYRSRQESASLRGMGYTGALLTGAVAVALLLSAIQILPTAEYVTQSPRSTGAERYEALTYSFWPWRFITLFAPDFFGSPAQGNYWGYATYWEDHAYIGMLPTVLALAALLYHFLGKLTTGPPAPSPKKSLIQKVVPFFGVCIPVSFLLALGWNTPIYLWLFDHIPGFGFFRAPARLLIWYTLAMAVLAGAGAQYITTDGKLKRQWLRLLMVAIAVFLGATAGIWIIAGKSATFLPATQKAGLLLTVAIGIMLLRPGRQPRFLNRSQWKGLALAFVTIDLLAAAYPLIPMTPATVFHGPIANAELLRSAAAFPRYFVDNEFAYQTTFNRYFTFEDFGPADEAHLQSLKNSLIPNLGVYAQLPSANNNDPLVISHWQTLMHSIATVDVGQGDRLLAVMGVQHRISGSPAANEQTTAVDSGEIVIGPVEGAMPHAYFAGGVRYAATESEALSLLLSPDFDYRREVIIIGGGDSRPPPMEDGAVTVTRTAMQEIYMQVSTDVPGYVILTETYYPGWKATVDDQPVAIDLANLAFRAVAVTPGQHNIVFRYRPASFFAGLAITIAAMLLTGLYFLRCRYLV